MKRFAIPFVVVAVALAFWSDGTATAQPQGGSRIKTGTIEGRVLKPDGSPAPGLRVAALSAAENAPQEASQTLISIGGTNDDGRYVLSDVPPGRYFIVTGPLNNLIYLAKVSLGPEGWVASGDSPLSSPLSYSIRGQVVREKNMAGESVVLEAVPRTKKSAAVPIAPDGSFIFRNVRPGAYEVLVSPMLATASAIVFVNDDISGLEIPIPLSSVTEAFVEFRTVVEGGGPIPRFTLPLMSKRIEVRNAAFRENLPLGNYPLSAATIQLPAGYTLTSIRSGPTDLLKEPLHLTAMGTPPVEVTVAPPPFVWVVGRLTGFQNLNIKPLMIRLIHPALAEPLAATVNPEGRFDIPMAIPGTYDVAFAPTNDTLNRTVTIPAGETARVEFPALPRLSKITGRMTAFSSGGVGTLEVVLHTESAGLPHPIPDQIAKVSPDGSFQLDNVQSAHYEMFVLTCANPQRLTREWIYSLPPGFVGFVETGYDPSCTALKGPAVDVTDRNLQLLVTEPDLMSLRDSPRTISGRVLVDGKPVAIRFVLRLERSQTSRTPCGRDIKLTGAGSRLSSALNTRRANEYDTWDNTSLCGDARALVSSAADGTFSTSVNLQTGADYEAILSALPFGTVIRSFAYGGTNITKQPLNISRDNSAEIRLDLSLDRSRFGTVSGRVTGIEVGREPVILTLSGGAFALSYETPVNPDGTFTISGVSQGRYELALRGSIQRNVEDSLLIGELIADGVHRVENVTGIEIAVPADGDQPANLRGLP